MRDVLFDGFGGLIVLYEGEMRWLAFMIDEGWFDERWLMIEMIHDLI